MTLSPSSSNSCVNATTTSHLSPTVALRVFPKGNRSKLATRAYNWDCHVPLGLILSWQIFVLWTSCRTDYAHKYLELWSAQQIDLPSPQSTSHLANVKFTLVFLVDSRAPRKERNSLKNHVSVSSWPKDDSIDKTVPPRHIPVCYWVLFPFLRNSLAKLQETPTQLITPPPFCTQYQADVDQLQSNETSWNCDFTMVPKMK